MAITKENRADLPPRGRAKKSIILEALKKTALSGLDRNSSNEEAEEVWFEFLARSAVDPSNKEAGACLRLLTERGWAALKATTEPVHFDFDREASPTVQAAQIIKAAADGVIPVEHATQLVSAVRALISVEFETDTKKRLEAMEALINGNQ